MLGKNMLAVDIVQHAVIGLGDHRHGPDMFVAEGLAVGVDHPAGRGVMYHPHRMGVGNADRAGEIAGVVNPVHPGHLAIAVKAELPGPDRAGFGVMAVGQDRRDPGADPRGIVDQRGIADQNAGDVRYGVMRPRRPRKVQPKVPGARFRHCRSLCVYRRRRKYSPTAATASENRTSRVATALISGFTPRRSIPKMNTGRVVESTPAMK